MSSWPACSPAMRSADALPEEDEMLLGMVVRQHEVRQQRDSQPAATAPAGQDTIHEKAVSEP